MQSNFKIPRASFLWKCLLRIDKTKREITADMNVSGWEIFINFLKFIQP